MFRNNSRQKKSKLCFFYRLQHFLKTVHHNLWTPLSYKVVNMILMGCSNGLSEHDLTWGHNMKVEVQKESSVSIPLSKDICEALENKKHLLFTRGYDVK